MAVSGFKISEIPETRVVCPDFFRIMLQILPKLFQIAPDGFGKSENNSYSSRKQTR
jgi:hypothetical protein